MDSDGRRSGASGEDIAMSVKIGWPSKELGAVVPERWASQPEALV